MDNGKPYTFTLTAEQCSALRVYLSMTSKQREESVSAWETLSRETKPDGSPYYPYAAGNAAYLRKINEILDSIIDQT